MVEVAGLELPPRLYWYDLDEIARSEWELASDDRGGALVIVEGDLTLGSPAEALAVHREIEASLEAGDLASIDKALIDVRKMRRWTDGLIRFELSPEFLDSPEAEADAEKVRQAALEWNKWTPWTGLRWEERTSLNRRQGSVLFHRTITSRGCISKVIGAYPRQKDIYINAYDCFGEGEIEPGMGPEAGTPCAKNPNRRCAWTVIMHEMGHMMGMRHEQRRHDRDRHIHVMGDNMISGKGTQAARYDSNRANYRAVGSYDTASIMHYESLGFTNERISRGAYLPVFLQRDVIERAQVEDNGALPPGIWSRAEHNRHIRLGESGIDLDDVRVVDIDEDGLDDLWTEHEGELVWSSHGASGWRPIRPAGQRVEGRLATSAAGALVDGRGIDLLTVDGQAWTLHAADGSRRSVIRDRSVRSLEVADVDGDGLRDIFVLWADRSFGLARGGDVLGPPIRLSSGSMGIEDVVLVRLQGTAGPVHAVAYQGGELVHADLAAALGSGDATWEAVFGRADGGPLPRELVGPRPRRRTSQPRSLRELWFVHVNSDPGANEPIDLITWSDGTDGSGMPERSPSWVADILGSRALGMERFDMPEGTDMVGLDLSEEVAVGHFGRGRATILTLGKIDYPDYPSRNDIYALGTLYSGWSATRMAQRYPRRSSGQFPGAYQANVAIGERIELEASFMSADGLEPVTQLVWRVDSYDSSRLLSTVTVPLSGTRDSVRKRFEMNVPGRYRVEILAPKSRGTPGSRDVAQWYFTVDGPVCGDGTVDEREFCDEGSANSDTAPNACRTSCRKATCGDGVTDNGESCDAGAGNSDTEPGATCLSNCALPTCGDGNLDLGEFCDAGAGNSDTTPNGCRTTCVEAYCGDGVPGSSEICDDGIDNSSVAPDACRKTCVPAHCGDEIVDDGESCDGSQGCQIDCTCPEGYMSYYGRCIVDIVAG